MDFFEQLNEATEGQAGKQLRTSQSKAEDWRTLFFGSELGKRVFGDMLSESGLYDTAFFRDSSNFFMQGKQYFVKGIIRTAGLDSEEGLHQLFAIKARAERKRKEEANG